MHHGATDAALDGPLDAPLASGGAAGPRSPTARRAVLAMAAAVVAMGLLQALPPAWHEALRYDRDAALRGQLWRLWTGHLIHLGWVHWALNMVGLLVCAALADAPPGARTLALRVGVLSLGVSALFLLAQPLLAHYVGLSGVLYGLFVLALWPGVRRGDPIRIAALGAIAAWLAAQLAWGPDPREATLIGGHIIVQAHVYGMVCAAAMLAVRRAAGGRRGRVAVTSRPDRQAPG